MFRWVWGRRRRTCQPRRTCREEIQVNSTFKVWKVKADEPWNVVEKGEESDDDDSHSTPATGAPGTRLERVTDGDVTFDGDTDRQVNGTCLRRGGQHENVRSDDRVDVQLVELADAHVRVERGQHEQQDGSDQKDRVETGQSCMQITCKLSITTLCTWYHSTAQQVLHPISSSLRP